MVRCVKCGLLAEYDSGLFDIKPYPYRPEQTHFVQFELRKRKKRGRGAGPLSAGMQERTSRRFSMALVRSRWTLRM
jgi:hypothetical protein